MAEENKPIGGIAAEILQQFVMRIERLEVEKKTLAEDLKQVYSEVKAQGFDVKILRKIVALRKLEDHDRREQDEIIDLYKRALGMD